jgi:hypothetical protein
MAYLDRNRKPKKCTDCKVVLDKSNSYKSAGVLHSKCLPCKKAYTKEWARKRAKEKNRWKIF